MKNHDFMSHELKLPELTLRGVILGLFITIVFTNFLVKKYDKDYSLF